MIIKTITITTKIHLGDGVTFTTSLTPERVELEATYVAALYRLGRKVEAIKHTRGVFAVGLKEAKYFCEQASLEVKL